jgi:WD40 repeat protein
VSRRKKQGVLRLRTEASASSCIVKPVCFSVDGTMVAARGQDSILVADPATGKDLLRLGGVRSRAFSLTSDGKRMAWSLQGEMVMRTTGVDGTEVRVPAALATVMAFSPDGTLLASVDLESVVRFWDAGARRELASVRLDGAKDCLAFSPDGAQLAIATERSVAIVPAPAR